MDAGKIEISIVTPSFNMLEYLPMCCASVADQGVLHEHIVMDGGSEDGTREWLKNKFGGVGISKPDKGMYNALNKAIDRTLAEIVGHLNCDEQYLPGTLKFVVQYFKDHPEIDFLSGNFLVVDEKGEFIAYRKSFKPQWKYFFSNYLYANTCTLFYRKKIFADCRFDESYKSIADVIFVSDVIKKGYKGIHIPKYFAVFTFSGNNLSLAPVSIQEKKRYAETLPSWYRILKPVFFALFFLQKILHGNYTEVSKMQYEIFTPSNLKSRTVMTKIKPGFRLRFKPHQPGIN